MCVVQIWKLRSSLIDGSVNNPVKIPVSDLHPLMALPLPTVHFFVSFICNSIFRLCG